ncbi:hypothetical protein PCC6912_20390 [Chlorogloeopsis fritschii PCC 6912]|uniref:NAD/NADP transhydrogenase beta subunit n=2 Tax=Chlorogloeopsidaceae TaxID=1892261 RepID=A0A3S1A262_CHLFR|nr:hypothetical protein [Chlorogloeopsis fritschii]RUR83796.1 hypothetical protein PCC6912_20390 [Chlorogloeopsis fritschii PCC 6912]
MVQINVKNTMNLIFFGFFYYSPDDFFGQDLLKTAANVSETISESFNELWQETLDGNLYISMCNVATFFALATLIFFMVELAKNWINQEDMKALSSWIWPILVIGLLASNGALLKSGTLAIRGYINIINNDVLKFTAAGSNLEVAYNRAVGNILLKDQVGKAMERCRSLPGTTEDKIQCFDQAEKELRKTAPNLFKGDAPGSGSWEFGPLAALDAAKDALSSLNPAEIGSKLASSITGYIGDQIVSFVSVLLLGLNVAYQWGIEFTMLLTALLAPLAVGGSLLPYGTKPIFAWLTGYFSVGMAKLCFNIMIGLCGQLIATSESSQPMIFLLFVGVFSPILASALAAGGGLAVWTGLGKAAEFTVGVATQVASAAATSGSSIAINVSKSIASKGK